MTIREWSFTYDVYTDLPLRDHPVYRNSTRATEASLASKRNYRSQSGAWPRDFERTYKLYTYLVTTTVSIGESSNHADNRAVCVVRLYSRPNLNHYRRRRRQQPEITTHRLLLCISTSG